MSRLHAPTLRIFPTREAAAAAAAEQIARVLARPAVLGLATGNTLVPVYEQLVRLHRAGLSFTCTCTFNLDEYWPIAPEHPSSFYQFMRRHLIEQVDLDPYNCVLPSGMLAEVELAEYCLEYERWIEDAGGVDLQLLGLGRNGHIGFNEPGSPHDCRTHQVELHRSTREDNRRAFPGSEPPTHAITMGIGTILEAREILLLAFGPSKAQALKGMLRGPVSPDLPASALRTHASVTIFADPEAARDLDECP